MIVGGSFHGTRTTGTVSVCEIACSIGQTSFMSVSPCCMSTTRASNPCRAMTSAVNPWDTESHPSVTHFLSRHICLILFGRTVAPRVVIEYDVAGLPGEHAQGSTRRSTTPASGLVSVGRINASSADRARNHPSRFNAVVSLPLPHIDASLREMERGLDQLGMLGVSMTCSCFDRSTAEAEFEPLYQEMNRRRTVLNYHPIQNGICSPMINDYGFTVSVGASLEDAAIVLNLISRRGPERIPSIKYVVPHPRC